MNWFKKYFTKAINIFMSDIIVEKKDKIQSILNVFETGSKEGKYGKVTIFSDGPKGIRQITYGKSQTTEWGNLNKLIKSYSEKNGVYSEFFKPYVSKIGKVSVVNDKELIKKLKEAGEDPVMRETQNEFFDQYYWNPALEFFKENGFTYPLSMLIIYDSFIHSGGILSFLRNRFPAKTPVKGGDEKKWIEQYINVRHSWLSNHTRSILRKTTYRTRNMIDAITKNNWNLDEKFNANGIIVD